MRIRVKICGITTANTAAIAAREGVDAVGFVFAKSPRQVSVEQAIKVARCLPSFVSRVAVMRHPTDTQLKHVLARFCPDVLQAEPSEAVLRAVEETNTRLLPVLHDDDTLDEQLAKIDTGQVPHRAVILEGPGRGGRGISPNWPRAAALAARLFLVLAGGLRPENVMSAIRRVRPFAVDVSSGVEDLVGVKSPRLIAAFCAAVRHAEPTLEDNARASGPESFHE